MMIRTRMVMMMMKMRIMIKMMFRDFIDNTLKRKAQAKREKRGQDQLEKNTISTCTKIIIYFD